MHQSSLNLRDKKLILASKSPRRRALLEGLGLSFEIRTLEVDEAFDSSLEREEIPRYLAKKKSDAFGEIPSNEILITSDTVVWLGDRVFNKPENREDAIEMLESLTENNHEVVTAVCLRSSNHHRVFHEVTRVHFGYIDRSDIEWYVDTYKPMDKAGAYGIQEWIGYVGIDRIEGSFYNVMGFPTRMFYQELKNFLKS